MTPKPQKIEGGKKCTCDDTHNDSYCDIHGQFADTSKTKKPQWKCDTVMTKLKMKWENDFDKRYNFESVYSGDILYGLNILKVDTKDFISDLLASERQRCVELAVKYMKGRSIDMPVGSPTPVIVTEHLAKLELLEQLK